MRKQKAPLGSGSDQAVSKDGSDLCRNSFTNALRSQSCIDMYYMNAFQATP